MKQSRKGEQNLSTFVVLLAGPAENRCALEKIFAGSDWSLCPRAKWALESCGGLQPALARLRQGGVGVVLCDSDLGDAAWKEILEHTSRLPDPTSVIVTSRLADEYLWAEALNLGAYDVLAKPFDAAEVERTLSMAWLRHDHLRQARPMAKAAAAGSAGTGRYLAAV